MVAKEESPAFQFYPKDYLSDVKTRAMSYKERGIYWELCSHIWLEKLLPADPSVLARILGLPVAEFKKAWPALLPCFRMVEGGFIEHPRLERERAKQQKYRDQQSASGKRGAAKKWGWQDDSDSMATPTSEDESPSRDGSPSASVSSSASAVGSKEQNRVRPHVKKGYLYRGRRFDVSERMFENLTKGYGESRVNGVDWYSHFQAWDTDAEAKDLQILEPLGWLRERVKVLMQGRAKPSHADKYSHLDEAS